MAVATCWVYRSLQPRCSCKIHRNAGSNFSCCRRLQLSASSDGPLPQLMSFCDQLTSSCLLGPVVFYFASPHLHQEFFQELWMNCLGPTWWSTISCTRGSESPRPLTHSPGHPSQPNLHPFGSVWKSQVKENIYKFSGLKTLGFIILSFFRFHDVSTSEQPTDPQWSYFQEQR